MRAAGRTLLSVVHAGVDAQFLNAFGCGSWQRLTDGQIRRSGALYHSCAGAGGTAYAGVIHYACGSYLAGAFAVEEIAGVDSIEQKTVAGVTLAVGPDGLIAQAAVGAGAAGKFRVHTW